MLVLKYEFYSMFKILQFSNFKNIQIAAKSHFVPKFQMSICHVFLDRFEQNLRKNVFFDQFFSLKGIVVEYCVLL